MIKRIRLAMVGVWCGLLGSVVLLHHDVMPLWA